MVGVVGEVRGCAAGLLVVSVLEVFFVFLVFFVAVASGGFFRLYRRCSLD